MRKQLTAGENRGGWWTRHSQQQQQQQQPDLRSPALSLRLILFLRCLLLHSCRTPRTYLIHSDVYGRLLDLQSVHCGRMCYFSSLLQSLQGAH